jgi:hypothetical protein
MDVQEWMKVPYHSFGMDAMASNDSDMTWLHVVDIAWLMFMT